MSQVRTIARTTAILSAAQILGLCVSLVGTILVTRALGPDGRAVYAWLLTLVGIAIQLALVAPPAAVRAIAVEGPERLPATLLALAAAGALATLPLAAYVLLDPTIGRASRPYLLLAWLAVPITAATASLFTLVQIEGRPQAVLAVHVAPRLLQAALAAALCRAGRLDLGSAIALFVLTAAAELAVTLWLLRARFGGLRPSLRLVRRALALIEAGWLSSVALFAVPRIGLIVLGTVAPLEVTGRYSVALTLQEAAMVAPVALGGVLITHVGHHGRPSRSTGRRAAIRVVGGAILISCAAALVAPAFIGAAFGPAFAPAAASFRILLASVVLATFYQLCQPLLFATRSPVAIGAPALGAFAVASAVGLVAVPAQGVDGAILSNLSGFATLAGLALWFSRARRTA